MKNEKNAVNPIFPSWEYIPDGEPHVFGDRVYVYGSHDQFGGYAYCLNDYVCWSAPTNDLRDWRYDGVIYKREQDPENLDGKSALYAPDVTQGPDGKFYLYYALNMKPFISVAVSDQPTGPFEFLNHVQDKNGALIGTRAHDEAQFDPAVLTEADVTYLYSGFCWAHDKERSGCQAMTLAPDMYTIVDEPRIVIPSGSYSEGTGFEGHEYFEAPSIRKVGDTYFLVYSSILMYELCYATSKDPLSGFTFGGTIISNNDMGIDNYKPADKPMNYGGNNHGGFETIEGRTYIFYHRHTNGTNYSRQACAEEIVIEGDRITQVSLSSCGLNGGPLPANGEYSAHIACNLFCDVENLYTGGMGENGLWLDARFPIMTQEGSDADPGTPYILNMVDSSTAGFKRFEFKNVQQITLTTKHYCSGYFEVKTSWDGEVLGKIPLESRNYWDEFTADVSIPDGVHDLYLTYRGSGAPALKSFRFGYPLTHDNHDAQ